ncbi:MAG TPA: membrane protein insertase YidC, partial [Pyrinomonadaceae bacterium]|nr:membrane protein insertase YidC [Pyrinomonadaceae bacterium]
MDQKRLVLAFVLSAIILFAWTFLVERNSPRQNQNANANANQSAATSPSPAATTAPSAPQPQTQTENSTAPAADSVPQRTVTVKTPLYEAKFDTRGAVATSWIITKNRRTGQPIYSVAGDKNSRQPLELIPNADNLKSAPDNIKQEARSTALRLVTGDAGLDNLLASRNYRVEGVEGDSGDAQISLNPGETKNVRFVLRDEATGTEVVKNISFDADAYSVGLDLKLSRGGQVVPSAKLAVGPSIGDQGIQKYSFYSIAPQGVSVVNGKPQLFYGAKIHSDKSSPDAQKVGGAIDWSGVG